MISTTSSELSKMNSSMENIGLNPIMLASGESMVSDALMRRLQLLRWLTIDFLYGKKWILFFSNLWFLLYRILG